MLMVYLFFNLYIYLFVYFIIFLQFFCSMASTFTLNFCLSGINGYGWGSFNQPGLLNFGVFSVCTIFNILFIIIDQKV